MGHTDHTHDHHHVPAASDGSLGRIFYWAIGLNMAYVIVEVLFGIAAGSMGLLSDAGHNLSDVASLLLSLIAFKASRRPATQAYTYGYGKATVEASLANAVILYVAVIFILVESVGKLIEPERVDGGVIAWVAGAGVIINGVTAWMLMSRSKGDINVKGAFMHMIADTLVSVGVVVSGIVIYFTGWDFIDPVIGIVIAVLIAVTSFSLLRESLRLALDGVPADIDVAKVRKAVLSVPGVESLHHLHIWPMSTTRTAMTVHVLVKSPDLIDPVIAGVRCAAAETGISHSTIEAETKPHDCGSDDCMDC